MCSVGPHRAGGNRNTKMRPYESNLRSDWWGAQCRPGGATHVMGQLCQAGDMHLDWCTRLMRLSDVAAPKIRGTGCTTSGATEVLPLVPSARWGLPAFPKGSPWLASRFCACELGPCSYSSNLAALGLHLHQQLKPSPTLGPPGKNSDTMSGKPLLHHTLPTPCQGPRCPVQHHQPNERGYYQRKNRRGPRDHLPHSPPPHLL